MSATPSTADLVERAVADTRLIPEFSYVAGHAGDFICMADDLRRVAVIKDAIERALDGWRCDNEQPGADIPPSQRAVLTSLLMHRAWVEVERFDMDPDDLPDFDRQGNTIPYFARHAGALS